MVTCGILNSANSAVQKKITELNGYIADYRSKINSLYRDLSNLNDERK